MGRDSLEADRTVYILRNQGRDWEGCGLAVGVTESSARRAYARHEAYLKRVLPEDFGPQPGRIEILAPQYTPPVPRGKDPEVVVALGTELVRVLFVPDMHIPYENQTLWALMMMAALDFEPQIIVIIGDFGDWKAVSTHLKAPKDTTRLKWEVERQKERLDELDALGAESKLYIAGNHEDRLERYCQEKAGALFDFINVPDILGLKERGWSYTPYMEHAKVGALYVTHDVGTAGIGAARKAMDVFGHSVVTGHSHRMTYVVEGNAAGDSKVSASFGWGGDLKAIDYMSRAKSARDWAHAFGIGYLDPETQAVHLVPVPLVGNRIIVEGRLYTA